MALTVEFLSLPNVVKMVGSKTITMNFSGQTIEDLIEEVTQKYGKEVRQFLLDETGKLDMIFRVVCNKDDWIQRDEMQRPLRDGDHVTIMMLVAGG